MIILGIDPGAGGGLALIGRGETWAQPMAETERDLWELVYFCRGAACAYIEAVHSMPKQGVASTFKFGMNYGFLRACLIAAGIPFKAVSPAKWKGAMGLRRKKGESDTAYKNRSKAMAQELFPSVKVTHKTSEALLIAEYGRRYHK